MLPDFNRLRIFYYIFKNLSVSIAAEEANITASAVSQQLKKLETEIGTRLFSRPHKGIVPTSAGKQLYETVKPFMISMEATISNLQRSRGVPSGLLNIGTPVEFGKVVMPSLISSYRDIHPDVRFHLKIGRTSELLPLVRDGELDFAFVDTFPTREQMAGEWGGLSISPVYEEVVVLACSGQYERKFLQKDYSFANMKKQRFISQQTDARAIRNWFYHNYRKNCEKLDVVLTVANHQAVVNAIKCGIGLGIIVAQLVREDITCEKIIAVQTGQKNPVNRVSLVQLLDKIPNLTEKSFQNHILSGLQQASDLQPLKV